MEDASGPTREHRPARPALRVFLLGGFRVEQGGREPPAAAWGHRGNARTLVKLLALAPGYRLHREQLVETLWPDVDPDSARNSFAKALHAARHALEPMLPHRGTSAYLRLTDDMLALDLAHTWVDVDHFERLTRAALPADDVAALEHAIAAYGGELLPEDRYAEWATARRETLAAYYLQALLGLASLHERCGDANAALERLRQALQQDPACEDTHRGLMRLYARGGDRRQALRQYELCRVALREELAVEPDAATERLHRDILASTGHDGRSATAGSAPAPAHRARHNLPAQPTPLVGRARDAAAASDLLRRAGVRLLTLTGPAGVGKTRLGLQVAEDLLDLFDDVAFVPLAPITDEALVLAAVARALGVAEVGGAPLLDTVKGSLRGQRTLLALDNFEQVTSAAPLVADLMTASAQLKILVTSRAPLHLRGEHEWAVDPLETPDLAHVPPPDALARYGAVALFVQCARAAKPGFALSAANAGAVAAICARLDGLPLAIELATARARTLSPEELLAQLDHPVAVRAVPGDAPTATTRPLLALLSEGPRDLPPRQQALSDAIAWSYNLLNAGEQAVFRRLAVFVGGCTQSAAEALCVSPIDRTARVAKALRSLADKSLLRRERGARPTSTEHTGDEGDEESRFGMLETIRDYGLGCLAAAGEEEMVRRRHAAYYLALGEAAAPELMRAGQAAALARLEEEHDNLREALRWAVDRDEVETGLRIAGAAWRFWYNRAYLTEGRAWLERLLARDEEGGRVAAAAVRAKALHGAGVLAYSQNDYERAVACYEESRALYCSQGQGRSGGLALVLNSLGNVARDRGDFGCAAALFEESLELQREQGDDWGIALVLNNLGAIMEEQGEYERAVALYEESLGLRRGLGDERGIADLLNNLSVVARRRGDHGSAVSLLEESLILCREMGSARGAAMALTNMGEVARDRGDHGRAEDLYRESLTLLQDIGDKVLIAACLEGMAAVASEREQPERTVRLSAAAAALRAAIGAPLPPAEQTLHDRTVAGARAALGAVPCAEAWANGQALSLEQAIAMALAH